MALVRNEFSFQTCVCACGGPAIRLSVRRTQSPFGRGASISEPAVQDLALPWEPGHRYGKSSRNPDVHLYYPTTHSGYHTLCVRAQWGVPHLSREGGTSSLPAASACRASAVHDESKALTTSALAPAMERAAAALPHTGKLKYVVGQGTMAGPKGGPPPVAFGHRSAGRATSRGLAATPHA